MSDGQGGATSGPRPGSFLGRWALAFGAATFVGLFFATRTYLLYNAYPDNQIGWGRALAPSLTSWYGWALLAPGILWLASRFRFEPGRRTRASAVHLTAGAAFALLHIGLDHLAGRALPWVPGASLTLPFVIARFHGSLLTYAAIVAGWNLVDAFRRARERELRASRLEARLAEARLAALRMQLHPHFLFNALHAVSTLMHRDVDAADHMLARLGDLLRSTLEHAGRQEVRLKEELDFLESYLEIERARLGERLGVVLDVDPDALDARVPNLLLQPLVENAIRHGVASRPGPGRVEIRAHRRQGELRITVEDDGPGLAAEETARVSSAGRGVGLSNCRARLEQLYGERGRLELGDAEAGGLRVSVTIPFRAGSRKARRTGGEEDRRE